MKKKNICCICGCEIRSFGNNPYGAMWKNEEGEFVRFIPKPGDRCCDECNTRYVIPGRKLLWIFGTHTEEGN